MDEGEEIQPDIYAPNDIRDDLHAAFYFAAHGMPARDAEPAEDALVRQARIRILRRSLPWIPKHPLPHGSREDFLGDYIPASIWNAWDPTRLLVEELRRYRTLAFVFENARPIVQFVDSDSLPGSLGVCDAQIMPWPDPDCIWTLNHEQEHPCFIDASVRVPSDEARRFKAWLRRRFNTPWIVLPEDARSLLVQSSVSVEELPLNHSREIRRKMLKCLGDITYIPSSPLNQVESWDYLWCYLPQETVVGRTRSEGAEFVLSRADKVVILFESRKVPAFIAKASDLVPGIWAGGEVYILDWPDLNWLLAFPSDDYRPPLFIWLRK